MNAGEHNSPCEKDLHEFDSYIISCEYASLVCICFIIFYQINLVNLIEFQKNNVSKLSMNEFRLKNFQSIHNKWKCYPFCSKMK